MRAADAGAGRQIVGRGDRCKLHFEQVQGRARACRPSRGSKRGRMWRAHRAPGLRARAPAGPALRRTGPRVARTWPRRRSSRRKSRSRPPAATRWISANRRTAPPSRPRQHLHLEAALWSWPTVSTLVSIKRVACRLEVPAVPSTSSRACARRGCRKDNAAFTVAVPLAGAVLARRCSLSTRPNPDRCLRRHSMTKRGPSPRPCSASEAREPICCGGLPLPAALGPSTRVREPQGPRGRRGEGWGEGEQPRAPTHRRGPSEVRANLRPLAERISLVAAPHPNPLPASGERESGRRLGRGSAPLERSTVHPRQTARISFQTRRVWPRRSAKTSEVTANTSSPFWLRPCAAHARRPRSGRDFRSIFSISRRR